MLMDPPKDPSWAAGRPLGPDPHLRELAQAGEVSLQNTFQASRVGLLSDFDMADAADSPSPDRHRHTAILAHQTASGTGEALASQEALDM